MIEVDELDDVDGDVNHFNALYPDLSETSQSKYYGVDEFNAVCHKSDNDSAIIHLNIRSLYPKLDMFTSYISLLNVTFDAIALSEVWLNDSTKQLVELPGYAMFNVLRNDRVGGGVGIFIRECFLSQVVNDISFCLGHIECIFVKSTYRRKTMIFGCIYRPPNSNYDLFLESLEDVLIYLSGVGFTDIFICGDFNVDLLCADSNVNNGNFLNLMLMYYFAPVITRPSRIDDTTGRYSLIDNIFCRNPNIFLSGLLVSSISDHYPVFIISRRIFNGESNPNNPPSSVKFRSVNDNAIVSMCDSLSSYDFSSIFGSQDVNEAFNELNSILMDYYNLFCPIKSRTISYKDITKPWIDREVKREIRRRENYYKLFKSGRLSRENFNAYRNRVTDLIRRRKREFYKIKFDAVVGDLKRTWSLINKVVSPNKTKERRNIMKLKISNNNFTDCDIDIANALNNYFSTVGSNIANSFDHVGDHTQFLQGNYPDSFFFSPATANDIVTYINSLKNKNCSIDCFPTFLLKKLSVILAPVLCHLVNLSLTSATFPDFLKIARVVPLPKGGDSTDMSNYRPVSVLHVFSKVVEKHVHRQLYAYLESNNILIENQFGFRYARSTSQAVLRHTEFIYDGLDDGDIVFAMYLDFKKAFDSVDHEVLLQKLRHYGVRGVTNDWFRSYLTGRSQFVNVNGAFSSHRNITHSVPQGSNLGPLLFLVFINDFPNCTDLFNFLLFADDSTVSCRLPKSSLNDCVSLINNNLLCVSEWLNCNKIMINVSKTKYMLYSYRGKCEFDSQIRIGDEIIQQTDSVKFLGVYLDNNLTFKHHILNVSGKISRNLGVLCRLREFVPKFIMQSLYYTLINPYILYAIEVWFHAPNYLSDQIKIIQKKAMRIVNNLQNYEHTKDHFINMRILPIDLQFDYCILVYVFRTITEPYFDCELHGKLVTSENIHNYPTRTASRFLIPRITREKTRHSLHYAGVVRYNALPDHLKNCNLKTFKCGLRELLLSRLAE